jgi:hypothetical protein
LQTLSLSLQNTQWGIILVNRCTIINLSYIKVQKFNIILLSKFLLDRTSMGNIYSAEHSNKLPSLVIRTQREWKPELNLHLLAFSITKWQWKYVAFFIFHIYDCTQMDLRMEQKILFTSDRKV